MNTHDDDMNTEDRDNSDNIRIAALYRAAARDVPAPELDALLRTAAARAARPRGLRSWRPALATAAVMLLIAGMLHESPPPAKPPQSAAREDRLPQGLVSPAAAPASAPAPQAPIPVAAAAAPSLLAERQQAFPAQGMAEPGSPPALKDQGQAMDRSRVEAERDKNPVADAAPVGAALAGAVEGKLQQEKGEKAAPAPGGLARLFGGPVSDYTSADKFDVRRLPEYGTPEKWLDAIRELRRRGQEVEARKSLAAFRKRYPDYALPAPLKDLEPPLQPAPQAVPAPPPAP